MARDTSPTLLMIEQQPGEIRLAATVAGRHGWRTAAVPDVEAAVHAGTQQRIDAVLLGRVVDDAPAATSRLRRCFPAAAIIATVDASAVALGIAAMREGASDVLTRPASPARIVAALDAAQVDAVGELRPLAERRTAQTLKFDEIPGTDPVFRGALQRAERLAASDDPILITGEPGTGKSLLAASIHAASRRSSRPFVTLNCGEIAANLIDSELFGHERDAFPGAFDNRAGRLQEADTGTLCLTGIELLPPATQERLAAAVVAGWFVPLGSRMPVRVDLRYIFAESIGTGGGGEPLHPALSSVLSGQVAALPPLRDRAGDIEPIAIHLLDVIGRHPGMRHLSLHPDTLPILAGFAWPGNVRQLHDVLFRASVAAIGDRLEPADFPQLARATVPRLVPVTGGPRRTAGGVELYDPNGHLRPLEQIEADVIRLAIDHYRGRMSEVARRLGIGRSTLYRRLGDLGIETAA